MGFLLKRHETLSLRHLFRKETEGLAIPVKTCWLDASAGFGTNNFVQAHSLLSFFDVF